MKTKHTQGEWIKGWGNGLAGPTTAYPTNPTVDIDRKFIPVSIRRETIAIVIQPENNSIEEMEANTNLITAAPKLLDAIISLKERLNYLISTGRVDVNKLETIRDINIANDVIKKATE